MQPLTHVLPQQDRDTIDRAVAGAEAFAKGADAAWADAARADARAADAARADAARADVTAAAAADWAAYAAAAADWAAAASDLDRLGLNPGEPDTLGAPIDPSKAGPLGPLWPQGVPQWYTEAATGTGTPHEEPSGDAD